VWREENYRDVLYLSIILELNDFHRPNDLQRDNERINKNSAMTDYENIIHMCN